MADENGNAGSEADATAREAAGAAGQDAADRMRDGAARATQAFTQAGAAMRQGGQKAMENGSQISLKMIDQAESNAREAFEAMRRAAQAKDLSEVMRVQGEYLRDQGSRSMAQARESSELIMQFGRDSVGAMRGGSGGSGQS